MLYLFLKLTLDISKSVPQEPAAGDNKGSPPRKRARLSRRRSKDEPGSQSQERFDTILLHYFILSVPC